jgi:hypothetical protein
MARYLLIGQGMKKDITKKLTLNAVVVRKLQQDLTLEQLKQVVGGATCDGSSGSRAGMC